MPDCTSCFRVPHCVFHCVLQRLSVVFWGLILCVLGSHIVCFRIPHCVFQGLSEDECARLHKLF